jgi:hypothetical protein
MRQQPWKLIALFVALEVIVLGGLGAWAAQQFGFDYKLLSPLVYIIQAAAGFFVTRAGGSGLLAGALPGFLDATSWAAFGGIGPQPTLPGAGPTLLLVTILIVGHRGGRLGQTRLSEARFEQLVEAQ